MRGDIIEMTANALGLMMESNGIRILEPFDTSMSYLNASGKTEIHLSITNIFMNFTFSILRLFLAVEEDILSFLRMTSKQKTVACFEFDKVGTIRSMLCLLLPSCGSMIRGQEHALRFVMLIYCLIIVLCRST